MSLLSLFSQASGYDYSYYSGDYNSETALALSAGVMVFAILFAIAMYVLNSIMLGKIFSKAGIEGWKAWVPVYNNWIMLELGGQKGYWAVVMLIPFVGIIGAIFMYIAMYYISLGFGKESIFVLLAIFLPVVWLIWLAVDGSKWKPVIAVEPSAAPVKTHTKKNQPPKEPVA